MANEEDRTATMAPRDFGEDLTHPTRGLFVALSVRKWLGDERPSDCLDLGRRPAGQIAVVAFAQPRVADDRYATAGKCDLGGAGTSDADLNRTHRRDRAGCSDRPTRAPVSPRGPTASNPPSQRLSLPHCPRWSHGFRIAARSDSEANAPITARFCVSRTKMNRTHRASGSASCTRLGGDYARRRRAVTAPTRPSEQSSRLPGSGTEVRATVTRDTWSS